jgi:hypothetical protein
MGDWHRHDDPDIVLLDLGFVFPGTQGRAAVMAFVALQARVIAIDNGVDHENYIGRLGALNGSNEASVLIPDGPVF